MAICCPKPVRAFAMRLNRLDACGVPLTTPNSQITSAAFVSLAVSPDVEAGNDILVKNGRGDICIQDMDCDRLKGFQITLTACGLPLPMLEMLLGMDLFVSGLDTVGGVLPDRNGPASGWCQNGFSLELWSKNADKGACAPLDNPYVQFVLPRTFKWQLSGDLSFEDAELVFELTGYAENNPNWVAPVPAEWDPAFVAQIQAGGPLAWQCVNALPTITECAYSV